jgi:NADH:ubiquinone oxidoreductase subunit H
MSSVIVAILWLGLVVVAAGLAAGLERRTRLQARADRPELAPPRAPWGSDPLRPPAESATIRAIAGFARMVRATRPRGERAFGLRRLARTGSGLALATALSLIPFAGTWGGGPGDPLLAPLDLTYGLVAIGLLLLLGSLARVTRGLADRDPWSRIGSVRQAGRTLSAFSLFLLVIAPLAIAGGSLRLHDLVMAQQLEVEPFAVALGSGDASLPPMLQRLRLPAWNVLLQPLTALLFIPAIGLLLRSPRAEEATRGAVAVAGFDLDAGPDELYWSRLEERVARVLASALFVTLFLGGGDLPGLSPERAIVELSGYFGQALPRLGMAGLTTAIFGVKWIGVMMIAARIERAIAAGSGERALGLLSRRLIPLAWANLLLVAALVLAREGGSERWAG